MPRATTKSQLLDDGKKGHEALLKIIATLTHEQMVQAGPEGDWSVKDILAHLTEWEQMVLRWIAASKRGEKPAVPGEGYKWIQIPALNQAIYDKFKNCALDEVMARFHASYQETRDMIESIPEEELFTRALYPWMNQNALGAFFTSNTSSHYAWALKEIKKRAKGK